MKNFNYNIQIDQNLPFNLTCLNTYYCQSYKHIKNGSISNIEYCIGNIAAKFEEATYCSYRDMPRTKE